MPRVSPGEQYKRYVFLRLAWLNFPKLYAILSLHEQWQLHEFYQPSKELTKAEFVAYIRSVTAAKPALAHQAGKHVRLMLRIFRHISEELDIPKSEWNRALAHPIQRHAPSPTRMEAKDGRLYSIAAVARPEVDVRKFTNALVWLASQKPPPDK